jgi:cysteine desulfurase
MKRIYLDNAATTPIDPEVVEVMTQVMKEDFGNPSSSHADGRKAKAHVESSRKTIATILNCLPSEIYFTSGGTEADNTIIRSCVESLGIKNIITSPLEHHAVLHTVEDLEHKGLVKVHFVKLHENGHVDLLHLEELLKSNEHVLVTLMHGNNEVGNLLPIEKVANLCKQNNAYFHSDTVQSMGYYEFDLAQLNVDFMVGAAHKFNGPKGIGFMFIRKGVKLKPHLTGGAQEREMRGGTENVYGIVGLAKALEISYRDLKQKQKHISNLKQLMIEKFEQELPFVKFNGDAKGQSLYTVLNVAFCPPAAGELLLFNFDLNHISISGGSACSSGSNKGSHVIRAIGKNLDCSPVRFSFGKYNTEQEINKVFNYIKELFLAEAKHE